jgi:cytochrome c oxidase subunit 2
MIDPNGTLFMPPQASTMAAEVDNLYYFIYYLCVFFFLLLFAGAVFFLLRYRRRQGGPEADTSILHNTPLEVAWSVIPLLILIVVFAWGFRVYMNLYVPPKDAMEIRTYAKRWVWTFEQPTGDKEVGELHVPAHRPVKLLMTAMDDPGGNVIHSFYVPSFRVKADVLPNRYNTLWFEATQVGTFQVFCTEYCGAGHSDMLAKIIVMEPVEYETWLKSQGGPPAGEKPEVTGEKLFTQFACVTCHKNNAANAAVIGPSLIGVMGKTEQFTDGTSATVDENYLRESILEPAVKVVKGYQPVMPPFKGTIKDWQVNALIAYIKTLK